MKRALTYIVIAESLPRRSNDTGAGNIGVFNDDGFLMLDIRGSFLEVKSEYEELGLKNFPVPV